MDKFIVELLPCDLEGVAILRPVGSIDASAAPVLESHFSRLYEKRTTRVVIDFSKSDFISSAGVGIMLGSVSLLREAGGDLIFMNVPDHISEVFEVINLESYFVTIKKLEDIVVAEQS